MSIFVRVLNPILMILLGLAVGIIVARQRNVEWKLYGIGAVTFIASQILHIPFNTWLLTPLLNTISTFSSENGNLMSASLLLGLSAGVFEETFRYLVYRFWIKNARRWKDALMLGAGHGGIEAILLGILTLFTVINIVSLTGRDLSTVVPAEQLSLAQQQIDAFWEAPWYGVMLGAIERAFAICFHLAASVLVLQVFLKKNIGWLIGAIGLHTLLNALAVYVAQVWGPYIAEGILAVFAILCIWIIFKLKPAALQNVMAETIPAPQPIEGEEFPQSITTDQIEDSKYV